MPDANRRLKPRNIKKNYIYNVSFQIFSMLIPFVTAPYVSRVLLPTGVGLYSYANSIATYFSLLAALGLSSYGLREVSRERDNKLAASKLFWELSIIRGVSTLLCLLLYLIFVFIFGDDRRVYLAAGLVILSVGVDCSWFFQAMENFKALSIRNYFVKIISVLCIFIFVRDADDLVLYVLIQCGSIFLSNLALRTQLHRYIVRVPLQQLSFRRHIRETLIYFIPTVATSVYTVLDRTMIGAITRDMAENGFYEQAHRIVNMLMTVITSLSVVVGVRTTYLFRLNKKNEIRQHIHSTFRFMFMVAFPLTMGLAACAYTFVPWFYGRGYEKVAPLLIMFSPLVVIIGISNVLGTLYLTPSGRRARSNHAIITGAVCNFLLNLILIPFIGVYGAVIASVAAETIISILYLRYSRKFVYIPRVLGVGARYLILSAVMFVPTWLVGQWCGPGVWTTLLQILVGVLVYAGELILTRDPYWISLRDKLRPERRKESP